MAAKTKKFYLLFANGTKYTIDSANLLAAQKRGHEKARRDKTYVIFVTESDN